jgi:hypothetical protein
LDSLSLEYSNGKPMPGPETLRYPDGAVNIYARGYDHYGNLIGNIRSLWSKTGSLPSFIPPTTNQVNVYIDASNAILDENGMVTATAPSGVIAGAFVSDSVQVIIKPRGANLAESPLTRDLSGNGYLDQILLKFDKPIPLSYTANIIVRDVEHNYTFSVDSLRPVSTASDSTSSYIIYLHDIDSVQNGILEPSNAVPQTSWRPLVSLSGMNGVTDFNGQKCKDGAGPVIWSVVIEKTNERSRDVVTVTFSEPIQASSGNDFSINIAPNLVFNTWKKDGGVLIPDTNLLACDKTLNLCISGFYKIVDPSTVQFNMLNQKTLFDYDYFSIKMPGQVADKANPANPPNANNQRVKVFVKGVVTPLQIGPNPAKPVFSKPTGGDPSIPNNPDPAVIDFKNDPTAARFAKENGGTVFRITISPGDTGQGRVTAYLNIYDVVGNVVNTAHKDGPNDDLMREIKNYYGSGAKKDTLGFYNYDIYWDGLNAKAMKAAPGVYHAFMYLTTYDRKGIIINKSRQQGIVGIGR